jgi:SAM-dependent methyltransferase
MITRDDVILCHLIILGREPEDENAITRYLDMGFEDFDALRSVFLNSQEFLSMLGDADVCRLLPPPVRSGNAIDCEASEEQLNLLLHRIQTEWEVLGKVEPHWSVLTSEEFKQHNINSNLGAFYNSGQDVKDLLLSLLDRHGLGGNRFPHCFELGCGVGRVTLYLSTMFDKVIAADISKYHLDICNQELSSRGIQNVDMVHMNSPALLKSMKNFDFFCSTIVLQHNPPPIMTFILDTVLRKLNPGGVAVFQLPTYMKDYRFNLGNYLYNPEPYQMEMHCLPQEQVFRIISRQGCRVAEVMEDGWIGNRRTWISNTFCVVKN